MIQTINSRPSGLKYVAKSKGIETILLTTFIIVFVAIMLAVKPRVGFAATNVGQAFGNLLVSSVRGTRVDIWTASHPSGYVGIAGLTGICTGEPCGTSQGFFETGFIKGTITPVDNQLQQFVAYKNPNLIVINIFNLGNLNNNSWYTFQTLYSNSASRWEAWRGSVPVFYTTALSFTSGARVVCGAEGQGDGINPPLGTQCNNMRYKVGSGSWTLYDYTYTQIQGPYCVVKPYGYSVLGYGPC
jgi:hypothetical protein